MWNILNGLFVLLLTCDILLDTRILCHKESEESIMHPPPLPVHLRKKRSLSRNDLEEGSYFWTTSAQLKLRDQLLKQQNLNTAKNVILFLGDGMSIPTLAASRIYLGQLQGNNGEESSLFFEEFPYVGLSKTYCVDKQVADSACTATAYLTGVKANYRTIGVTAAVNYNDCNASNQRKNHVSSIATWAQSAGKGTGIVTTTRVTHASPAGTYAHVGNREWECDADVKLNDNDPKTCQDIASQLINNRPGKDFKVILGGGRSKFLPEGVIDEEGQLGQRLDNINLIDKWKKTKTGEKKYVYDKKGLNEVDYENTDYLLGLFESEHLQYHLDANNETEPTLLEMTVAAIKLLQKEKNGYFLFVEGGRIDTAHHQLMAKKALDETIQFSEAVRKAVELTSREDTLIVVTSDHSHTMSIAGYSDRGVDILGLNSRVSNVDQLPYSTLAYANGPHINNHTRESLNKTEMEKNDFQYPSFIPLEKETHGGDDVGVFALGPWSHLFTGVYEQNVIPHIIAYASCIGEGLTTCKKVT